jgi:cysteinyl-tRNA synthetase
MHWNMLTLAGEKMAKSKGHVVELAALFATNDPMAVRFHLLRSHYRSLSDFAVDALEASSQGLQRLRSAHSSWRTVAGEGDASVWSEARARFVAAMNDDLHTPEAIAVLFEVAREGNRLLERGHHAAVVAAADLFDELLVGVLGVRLDHADARASDEAAMLAGVTELLLEQRLEARKRRDFSSADAIRDRLADLGIAVEDTTAGSRWRRSG